MQFYISSLDNLHLTRNESLPPEVRAPGKQVMQCPTADTTPLMYENMREVSMPVVLHVGPGGRAGLRDLVKELAETYSIHHQMPEIEDLHLDL
jgi:hypothetical protein